MKTLVITIHGWNSGGEYMRFANGPLQREGLAVKNFDYGWILAKTLKNAGIVDRLVADINWYRADPNVLYDRFVLLGHSNGCELAWRIARRCEAVIGLSLHNAALDDDVHFPSRLQFVHNWFTPDDAAVKWGSWLPFNSWGDLGAKKYAGTSSIVKNFNKGRDFEEVSEAHSDTFTDPALRDVFLPATARAIVAELGTVRGPVDYA